MVSMLSTTFSDFIFFSFNVQRCFGCFLAFTASYIVYSHTCAHWCGVVVSQRRDLLGEKRNAASVRCLLNTTGISTLLLYYITFAFLISKLVRPFVIEPLAPFVSRPESREFPITHNIIDGVSPVHQPLVNSLLLTESKQRLTNCLDG